MIQTTASEAFNHVIQSTNIVSSDRPTYSEAHSEFPFVVVRDTLLRLGIGMAKASRMACERQGSARNRFDHLKKELQEMGFYHARN